MTYKKLLAEIMGIGPAPEIFEVFQNAPRIVFYHGITDKPIVDKTIQANQIPFHIFKKQINYLNRRFTIVSLDDIVDQVKSNKLRKDNIALTFDDGYENNYFVAAPYLEELGLPFTIFICPELIQNRKRIPTYYVRSIVKYSHKPSIDISCLGKKYKIRNTDEKRSAIEKLTSIIKTSDKRLVDETIQELIQSISVEQRHELDARFNSEELMNWDMVNDLDRRNVTIGSHTLDHTILHKNQDIKEIDRQMINSKQMIIDHIGECKYFSFPNGSFPYICHYSIELSRKLYKASFIVDGKALQNDTDYALISRIGANDSLNLLRCQLSILSVNFK